MKSKKRILFVDDEPAILSGLQRSLRSLRASWSMEFVTSGEEALQRMEQEPFDVVVSDMRMPGMNGAELLHQVMRMSPRSVRIILSGYADQELVLRSVGTTHQFLAKPCSLNDLKSTLERATCLEDSLKHEMLKSIVSRMDRIPSMPNLYFEILKKLEDADASINEISAIVAKDLGMTAKILKLVNSAFFGLRRQISNPFEAVSFLGLETIKSLVLGVEAFSRFESVSLGAFRLEYLWDHSLKVATMARSIARMEALNRVTEDGAFVAGLLHDVGKLVLAGNFPADYQRVEALRTNAGKDAMGAEAEIFEVNHAEVGGYLLGLWGLPVPVVEAIALHHTPRSRGCAEVTPLTMVHMADALVHGSHCLGGAGGSDGGYDELYLAELGLTDRMNFLIKSGYTNEIESCAI